MLKTSSLSSSSRRFVFVLVLAVAALGLSAVSMTGCEDKKDATEKPSKAEAIEVIQGDKPTWPAELEGVAFGDPLSKLEALDLEAKRPGSLTSGKYTNVIYGLDAEDPDGATVDNLTIRFRKYKGDLAAELTQRWGEPTRFKSLATEYLAWFNPEAKLRARITAEDPSWIDIERYTPMTEFLGPDPGVLAFEKDKPLLGKTLDEIKAEWGDQLADGDLDKLELPPLETEIIKTRVYLDADDGAPVHGYRFDIAAPPDAQQGVRDALEAKFGAPVMGKDLLDKELAIYTAPEQQMRLLVKLEDPQIGEGFEVQVERILPLETVIGDAKTKLGIEGEATWLGTAEADWKSKIANDDTRLKLAPTPFGSSDTRVSPRFTDGKLSAYQFDLRCDLQPDGCPQIVAAFKKAFGEPTAEKDILQKEVLVFNSEPPIALETGTLDGYTVVVGER